MDAIKNVLFENTLWIMAGLALAELALAAIWHEKRTRRWALLLLGPPVLAGVYFLVGALVETDRDRIIAASRQIAADIQADRIEALEKYLAPGFRGTYQGATLDKEEAIATCRSERANWRITQIRVGRVELDIHGRRATMRAPTAMRIDSSLGVFDATVIFRLRWVKTGQLWQITRAEEPERPRM